MKISNMAELKRALHEGAIIKTIAHQKPELTGLMRQVTKVQTNAVYTVIPGQPDHKWFNLPVGTIGNHLIMEFQVI